METLSPATPDEEFLDAVDRLAVDTTTGKVVSSRGKEIGCVQGSYVPYSCGYVYVSVWGRATRKVKKLKRANIVWYKATGEWPKQILDHVDRNYHNDALSNLKPCTQKENVDNSGLEFPNPTKVRDRWPNQQL